MARHGLEVVELFGTEQHRNALVRAWRRVRYPGLRYHNRYVQTVWAVMRKPGDVGNLQSDARRRMPALMRGNEGLELVLTLRQLAKLSLADGAAGLGAAAAAVTAAKPQAKLDTHRIKRPLRSVPRLAD